MYEPYKDDMRKWMNLVESAQKEKLDEIENWERGYDLWKTTPPDDYYADAPDIDLEEHGYTYISNLYSEVLSKLNDDQARGYIWGAHVNEYGRSTENDAEEQALLMKMLQEPQAGLKQAWTNDLEAFFNKDTIGDYVVNGDGIAAAEEEIKKLPAAYGGKDEKMLSDIHADITSALLDSDYLKSAEAATQHIIDNWEPDFQEPDDGYYDY